MQEHQSVSTSIFRKLFWNTVRSVTTPSCAGCRAPNTAFCADCHAALSYLTFPTCYQCGLPRDQRNSERCRMCDKHGFGVDHLWSSVAFEGPIKDLIHAFKYENQRALALELTPLMLQFWPQELPDEVVLVPVPLSSQRKKERGYNQAELLATQLSEHTQLPISRALNRTRHTAAQAYKSAADRRQNLHAAFEAAPATFENNVVILIDDVCTTGATLEACASACRTAGAAKVWATTVARAF